MVNWADIHEDFAKQTYPGSNETYQHLWEKTGFTYQEAQEWVQLCFKPDNYYEVVQWKNLNFVPQEAKSWREIGLDKWNDAEFAAYLRGKNKEPNQDLNLEQLREEFDAWLEKNKSTQEYLDIIYPKSQRKNIKKLVIWGKNLTNVLDLKDFEKLEELDCSNNYLTSLDNIGTNLKKLVCHNNNLTDLNLTLHELEELDCSFNQCLKKLNFSNSKLTILDLTYCPNLIELEANHSTLTDLNFLKPLNLKKLEKLSVQNNPILPGQNLSILSSMKELKKIDISNCNFGGSLKPLESLDMLREINISHTNISEGLEYLPKSCQRLYCELDYDYKTMEIIKELGKSTKMENNWYDLDKWRINQANNKTASIIPLERLFVIRGNIKQFLNKWGKEHENDWYEWIKNKIKRSGEKGNELAELQSPQEAKWDRGVIVGYRVLNNALATTGIVLSFQGSSDIGAGLLGVYPINEFFITYLEKSLNNRETKWKEFLNDADNFSDNFNELLAITKSIRVGELGEVNKSFKNLKKKVDEFLKIYDADGNEEIDLEELIIKKKDLAGDLAKDSKKKENKLWRVVDVMKELENKVTGYRQGLNIEEEIINNHHAVDMDEQTPQILHQPYGTPGSSKNN